MAIYRVVRGPVGDLIRVTDEEYPGYVTSGYVPLAGPWIEDETAPGAADTTPRHVIAHADGRTFAVTFDNWLALYEPLGFVLAGTEMPGAATPADQGADLIPLLAEDGEALLTEWGAQLFVG